jgi:hypothetical protein
MATDESIPEGFTKGPSNDLEQDVETVELEPGEQLLGTIVDTHEDEGEYGPWVRLRVNDESRGPVDYFAKDEAKTMYFAGDLEIGDDVFIRKEEETDEIDGNEYHPTICRTRE